MFDLSFISPFDGHAFSCLYDICGYCICMNRYVCKCSLHLLPLQIMQWGQMPNIGPGSPHAKLYIILCLLHSYVLPVIIRSTASYWDYAAKGCSSEHAVFQYMKERAWELHWRNHLVCHGMCGLWLWAENSVLVALVPYQHSKLIGWSLKGVKIHLCRSNVLWYMIAPAIPC